MTPELPARRQAVSRPDDLPAIPPGPPMVIVLSGPSGAGKDAVRDLLISWDLPAYFAVTATTRPPRPGEVEGIDYHFISDADFDRLEREDGLVEHAIVYGQRKGVPKAEVLEPLARGEDVIARVDVQGAATLQQLVPAALLIFIAPPSLEEMERRLGERETETEEEMRRRLDAATGDMAAASRFDHVVVNETGKLEETARQVVQIIAEEKRRRSQARAGHHRQGATG